MSTKKALSLLFACIGISFSSYSQQITNVQASIQGDNIVVTYDLAAENAADRFDISLFSSHNNYSSPVNLVSGDVGRGITPGNGKRIVWQARQELNTYTGNITFEVRGTVIPGEAQVTEPGQLTFQSPQAGDAFKMGKSTNILWRGGLQQDVKLELYKDNMLKQPITTTQNSGSYTWPVPKDKSLKGSNYTIKLFNINQPGSAVMSGEFRIKGKTPVVIYILPAAVVAGVVLPFLLKGGGDGGDPCATDPCSSPLCPGYSEATCNPLPAPPAVPSGN